MKRRAFTLLELILSMLILSILAAAVVPVSRVVVKRGKEAELRRKLLEIRTAIDRFKKASEEGLIDVTDRDQYGYPADFEELISGLPTTDGSGKHLRFLRRIPVDPFTGEAEWGMRSVQDEPDSSSWGSENLFDVYSLSDGTALDGTEYGAW